MTTKLFTMPLAKEDLQSLVAGDSIELTGTVLTARDAAHKRIQGLLAKGEKIPVDFTNQFIFFAGPCPARPGRVIGSIAPTTSMRMDSFTEMSFQLGILGMIGKGERAPFVAELCKKYRGIYFLSIGGASALISQNVTQCEVLAFEDLGTESIKRLTVEKLRLIVGIDSRGKVFQDAEIQKYRRPPAVRAAITGSS